MLPPALVLTNKKCGVSWMYVVFLTVWCAWLTGCSPPGPRHLLQGKQLVDEGRYEEAIQRLEKATELLPKHPLAWNYLGLAYHANRQLDEAAKAYGLALSLDHKLTAVRYNLGCLYLEQDKYSAAIDELHSYTLLQPSVIDGWIKLGTALLGARRLAEAEKSFRVALDLQARHPEAVNGLGLVQVQRRRLQDALNHFNVAALQSPPYGPALLNSAIVNQQLNNPALALQRYRQYVAQEPRPADADAVAAAMEQLELAVNPPGVASRTSPSTSLPVPDRTKANVVVAQASSSSQAPSVPQPRPQPSATRPETPPTVAASKPVVAPPSKINTAPTATARVTPEPTKPVVSKPEPAKGAEALLAKPVQVEVTELRSNLVVRPAQELTRAPVVPPMPAASLVTESKAATNVAKRGFFSRINPFGKNRSGARANADRKDAGSSGSNAGMRQGTPYSYLSPAAPTAGNPVESDKAFNRGLKAHKSGSRSLAITEYQAAIKADPANYDAYYNLGLAALEGGDARLSLWAYEIALALKPDAGDAHYNFALALKSGGHWLDAVEQLEDLIAAHDADARAHLSLANLYSQQLQQPGLARVHYQRVLELNPRHPEAAKIRYWLAANP